jgi:hypothetical protein
MATLRLRSVLVGVGLSIALSACAFGDARVWTDARHVDRYNDLIVYRVVLHDDREIVFDAPGARLDGVGYRDAEIVGRVQGERTRIPCTLVERVEYGDQELPRTFTSLIDTVIRLEIRDDPGYRLEGITVAVSDSVLVLEPHDRPGPVSVAIERVERLQYGRRTHPYAGTGGLVGAALGFWIGTSVVKYPESTSWLGSGSADPFAKVGGTLAATLVGLGIGTILGRLAPPSYQWTDVPLGGDSPDEPLGLQECDGLEVAIGLSKRF